MNEDFVLKKNIDWSIFFRGFAVPIEMQAVFSLHLSNGSLFHGEKRTIKIIFGGENHSVTLTSVNFDRKKYPEHSEMWQIIYGKNSSFAKSMRKIFSDSLNLLEKNRQDKNFILPAVEREYFVLYATDLKDIFYLEPIFNSEILNLKLERDEPTLENLFEIPTLTDSEAEIIEKYRLTKVRKLNRSIGNYLKKLYNFRCQICGHNVGEVYGAKIVECHHIDYFVQSLNNDADNLLIVCPNHHRIIHAANPTFDKERKIYIFQNGYEENLRLNFHL